MDVARLAVATRGNPALRRLLEDFDRRLKALETAAAPPAPPPDATDSAAELIVAHGLDPHAIQGTGSGGRILKSDVEQHIAAMGA